MIKCQCTNTLNLTSDQFTDLAPFDSEMTTENIKLVFERNWRTEFLGLACVVVVTAAVVVVVVVLVGVLVRHS